MNNIGVVVIGKNEGYRLKCCLESLKDLAKISVYVDSQSSDDSVNLALSMGFQVIVLDDSKPVSRPRARNEGYRHLKSNNPKLEFVHFLDGDATLSEGWLDSAIKKFISEPNAAIVCGKLHEKDMTQNIYRRLCNIEWFREPGELEVTGGIVTIRIDALEQIGGYNETIRGEDFELCRRLRVKGMKIFCIDQVMGVHDSGISTFSSYWHRGVKGGYKYVNNKQWDDFAKERKSIAFWVFFLPLLSALLLFAKPILGVAVLSIYPIKILQTAYHNRHRGAGAIDAIVYGISCYLIKIAELYGMVTFILSRKRILSD